MPLHRCSAVASQSGPVVVEGEAEGISDAREGRNTPQCTLVRAPRRDRLA